MDEIFGPLERAVHDTVHEYVDRRSRRRGAVALAALVGMQPGTLSNKANPTMDSHQLTLRESVPLQAAAGDFRILHAYAASLGHCAYPLPENEHGSDMELLSIYSEFHARLGTHSHNINQALVDGRISRDELQGIRMAFDAAVRAGLGVMARLESLT